MISDIIIFGAGGFLLLILVYIVVRLISKGIFESYFDVKQKHKEEKLEKRSQENEGSFIKKN